MMRHAKIIPRVLLYAVIAGLAATVAGCSQGPISNEEAEDLRGEVKTIREQLTRVESRLADVAKATDDKNLDEQVQDLRKKLDLMAMSLFDVEEALKPKELPRSSSQSTPGRMPPGGAVPGEAVPESPGGAQSY